MARGGINKALVQKARQALLSRGEHPSIDAVRVELGNTGSKTTIHRYLKEIEEAEHGRGTPSATISEQLLHHVSQLAERLEEEAQASVNEQRERFEEERLEYELAVQEAQRENEALASRVTALNAQLLEAEHALALERESRQQSDIQNARLSQETADLLIRVQDRDHQIASLEQKHTNAREALEHFRQASAEQRDLERRRHEAQLQQMQVEIRQLQQTLILKQDEVTVLNRDNARLITEAQQQSKRAYELEDQLAQKTNACSAAEGKLLSAEQDGEALKSRCLSLEEEVTRLTEASDVHYNQLQEMQARFLDTIAQLTSADKRAPGGEGGPVEAEAADPRKQAEPSGQKKA